jgi:hypothetical protein
VGGPGLAGFRFVVGGLSGNGRDANKVIATRALNFPAGIGLIALQMLIAVRATEFEVTHNSPPFLWGIADGLPA